MQITVFQTLRFECNLEQSARKSQLTSSWSRLPRLSVNVRGYLRRLKLVVIRSEAT